MKHHQLIWIWINLDTERGTLSANDPREIPLYEIEVSPCFVTSPRTAILPLCAGPAEPQEESPEPNREDNGDTIVVECGTSDGGSESSDDSDDENYVEEPPRLAKRRRVRFSDTEVFYFGSGGRGRDGGGPGQGGSCEGRENAGIFIDVGYGRER
jgi:hypothetical protein